MKCYASRTTSIVPDTDVFPRHGVRHERRVRQSHEVAAQFAAILTKAAFTPLAGALGFYGDLVVGEVAQTLARREHGGLTDDVFRLITAAQDGNGSGAAR